MPLTPSLSRALNGALGVPVIAHHTPGAEAGLRGALGGFRVRTMPLLGYSAFFLPGHLADHVAGLPGVDAVFIDRRFGLPEVRGNGNPFDFLTAEARIGNRPLLSLLGPTPPPVRKVGATTAQALQYLGVPAARALGVDGEGVRVAIVDTNSSPRFAKGHPQMVGKPSVDRNTVHAQEAGDDTNGHGSHVTTIAAGNPWTTRDGVNVEGVAPATRLLLEKVLFTPIGTGSESDIIAGIDHALQWAGQDQVVINMSLGEDRPAGCPPPPADESALCQAINAIPHERAIFCVASGNSGSTPVGLPAACSSAIAVGATDLQGRVTSFSTYGPEVLVAMPGLDITSGIEEGTLLDFVGKAGPFLGTLSGTSMATPFATGMVALASQYAQAKLGRRLTRADFAAMMDSYGQSFNEHAGFGPLTWRIVQAYIDNGGK